MATDGQINTDILSDEFFDELCTICKSKSKNTEGVKFCLDCQDYFCIICVQVHSQVPVCAGHKMLDKSLVTSGIIKGLPKAPEEPVCAGNKVLDKSQVESGISKSLPKAPTEMCDRHSHKLIDMYCQNHDSVGCSTCMADNHRSCQEICYIPEYIQNNTYQAATTDIQTKLKEISKSLAEQVTRFKQDKQRLLKRKEELLADIRKFRQEINNQLDKLENNSIGNIEDMVKHLEDKIENNLKNLQAHMARVTSANDKLASQNTSQAEVFIFVKIGEDTANAANKCIEDNKTKRTRDVIKLQPEKRILTLLQQYKALGKLGKKGNPAKTPSTLFKIKGKQSYCVTATSYEEDNYSRSACCLKDGTVILADRKNKKLKRFHSNNNTIIDYCDLPAAPWQVCSINTTQVAVTLPLQKEVHFISVEGQMSTTNKINTDFSCSGLAYTNNNLYVSDDTKKVYVYTLSGRKIKQLRIKHSFISHLKNQLTRTDQLRCINSLAVSKDAKRIYVTDRDRGLIVLDKKGKVITRFNGGEIQWASCCYVTEAGSVLVSGSYSNNVIQFTSDGELLGEVIKSDRGKWNISSVCCNQQMSKMYVCRSGKSNIEVYDI
ncbi:uncharacterized protein LOC132736012 [Ruditapes philippinarum]|uniref:uncharacterized protein LOC132736012 n=1 Tax=Ruditapes philippinarum TaxID=129788 RepID=UPI00295BE8A4|nr:uncharacterized protein LOC132736012 [Ruditapes philippinarum]